MVKIAILGFGTVGSGVYEVIRRNGESFSKKAGQTIDIKYIMDIRDFDNHIESNLFTKSFEEILEDDEVSIVVEVIGGIEPAYSYTKKALLAGKHVVTSNKELVATKGAELLAIAQQNNINYMFEASVGGGIPIIRPLNQCLAANEITEIMGILNGTTNYILTKMIKKGQSFSDALKDAQDKGYAERNPAADVEGHDTCRKIAILSSLVFGRQINADKIYTEGITSIALEDIEYAQKLNSVIKLIGYSHIRDKKVFARVSPLILPGDHPLATVEDVFNGILVKGDAIGDVMFYGRGAGKLPTASAVVADVIDIVKNDQNHRFIWSEGDDSILLNINDEFSTYLVRVGGDDTEQIRKEFGNVIFVKSEKIKGEFAFITPQIKEGELNEKINKIDNVLKKIRMY